jgi:hypothetical protein
MGQELFDVKTVNKGQNRVWYLGVTSDGIKAVRGSAYNRYTHAVVRNNVNDLMLPHAKEVLGWATFHATKDLAEREYKRATKWVEKNPSARNRAHTREVVELQKVTAQEVRAIKKAHNLALKKYLEEYKARLNAEGKNPTTDTE